MKKAALISFSLVMVLSGCKKKSENVDTSQPVGKNLLTTLINYEICATSFSSGAPEEVKANNKRLEALKSNKALASILSTYDNACTEPERKIWHERMLCAEKACKQLTSKPEDLTAHVNQQCPDNIKAPPWTKKCRTAYDKIYPHIKPTATL